VVAQKLFAIPWKEVAIIVINEQKSGLSEHGKPLFLFPEINIEPFKKIIK